MTASSDAFDACLRAAASHADDMMKGLVGAGLQQMFRQAGSTRTEGERNALQGAVRLLDRYETFLRHRFGELLLAEFTTGGKPAEHAAPIPGAISFDKLELMDDVQVQERVELARVEQSIRQVAEAELEELNRLICGAQGLDNVNAERNPMRPAVYARALNAVLAQTGEPAAVRLIWIQALGGALGASLALTYRSLCQLLRDAGVERASYLVVKAHDAASAAPAPADVRRPPITNGLPAAGTRRGPSHSLLTLEHLRRLLAGDPVTESEPPEPGAGEPGYPETPASEPAFSQTVPAAFEALQEMKQVDAVIRRLTARRHVEARRSVDGEPLAAVSLKRADTIATEGGHSWGQALALEVVDLMIDNIAGDARLVEPVQMVVKALHPALMSLALKDPRFFSDRHHPARCLLAEITERGLAFGGSDEDGFADFFRPVVGAVDRLALADVEDAEPFEAALSQLHGEWAEKARRERERRDKAVQALVQAERRTMLANRISRELRERSELSRVVPEVVSLLVGPWAQVMAQARLDEVGPEADPGGYGALVPQLLWSAQPELARHDRAGLAAMVPHLIRTLRQGLRSIDYPPEHEQALLDVLMGLHQQALARAETTPPEAPQGPMSRSDLEACFERADESDLWVVAREAQDSGYFDSMPPAPSVKAAASGKVVADVNERLPSPLEPSVANAERGDLDDLTRLGSWVEFFVDRTWYRSQLTWTNPRGNLFMFTGASGKVQSMTLRSLTRLFAEGKVRLLAVQPLMEAALDEVARTALHNSVQESP